VLVGCSLSADGDAWPLVRDYAIGETGPAGGTIFYDKGDRNEGWRYLEAGPSDLTANVFWNNNETFFVDTGYHIGSGESNSFRIVDSIGGDPLYAPQQCLDYASGPFDDWFLPSHDELFELFNQRDSVGGFQASLYWSSTEDSASNAWAMDFANEIFSSVPKTHTATPTAVRPIRAF